MARKGHAAAAAQRAADAERPETDARFQKTLRRGTQNSRWKSLDQSPMPAAFRSQR